jgi:hypothetical protein
MAITQCRECKKEVSDIAATCPHCGAPSPNRTSEQIELQAKIKKSLKRSLWAVATIVASFFAAMESQEFAYWPFILLGIGFLQYFYFMVGYAIAKRKLNISLKAS